MLPHLESFITSGKVECLLAGPDLKVRGNQTTANTVI